MDNIYTIVSKISREVPVNEDVLREKRTKEIRGKLYFKRIDDLLTQMTQDVRMFLEANQALVEQHLVDAAKSGVHECPIYEWQGQYGRACTIEEDGVTLECNPLPVQFLGKGPKQSPQNRTYGLRWFTVNGIDPLVNRLQMHTGPFGVTLEIEKNKLVMYLKWEVKDTEQEEEENEEEDDMDISL